MHVLRKREPAVVLNYWHFITVPSQWLKDTVINKNQNEDTDINLHTNGRTDLNRKFSVEKKSQVSEIHLKKFIMFIDIMEMQIKTSLRFCLIFARMAKFNNISDSVCWQRYVIWETLIYCCGVEKLLKFSNVLIQGPNVHHISNLIIDSHLFPTLISNLLMPHKNHFITSMNG